MLSKKPLLPIALVLLAGSLAVDRCSHRQAGPVLKYNLSLKGSWVSVQKQEDSYLKLEFEENGGYLFLIIYKGAEFMIDQGVFDARPDTLKCTSLKKGTKYCVCYDVTGSLLSLDMECVFKKAYDQDIPVDFFIQKSKASRLVGFLKETEGGI